ncbi:MAG: carbohydrate kinase [Anaerolineae bacterium]|nr:carbohydrate kinase [Anaerolineae bacterium]
MERERLQEILAGFAHTRVLVVGDYFLDKYLDIDRSLAEISLETGLEAHQVFRVRASPGAAGTVVSNLRALEVQVVALGVIGDDGEGYELLRGLQAWDVETAPLLRTSQRMTPTYTKPMMHEPDGRVHELSRLDIKNRTPLPPGLEETVIARLQELAPTVQAVVVADQVPERNCGVITDRVREAICSLAAEHPELIVVADSRMRIGEYRHVSLKPNEFEALRALGQETQEPPPRWQVEEAGRLLAQRAGRPVFVTIGEEGILVCTAEGCQHVPAVPVSGEIDIVGAGDSALAGIVSGLCSGASLTEAALIGNLVASVTVKCIGTTGTASQEEVLAALGRWREAHA